jgi:endonuclease/exonuclease/phosphatase family metal-dependent hydrolase
VRRPATEVLWTMVLVVVLVAAGSGVAAVTLSRSTESAAPAEPASADVTPSEPSPPRPSRSGPASPAPPEATAHSCRDLTQQVGLRVLTLNTHGAQGHDGFDLDRVAAYIRRADVDVALLQEVDRFRGRSRYSDMPRVLAARTGMEVAYGMNVDLPGRAVSGTATLSRLPILSQQNVRLPTAPGRKPRGLLRTDVDVDGVRVSIFNTHLEDLVMALKLRQVAAMRGPVARTRHPAILGGDLNAVSTSPMMANVRRFLTDSWVRHGFGPGHTFPARAPRLRIDYLYHSPGVRVGSIAVMSGRVSDHRALRARFLLTVAGDEVCVPELDGAVGGSGPGRDGAGRAR